LSLFAGCPDDWQDVSFDRIHARGGFVVSATRSAGRLTRLEVRSLRGGTFGYLDPGTGQVRTTPTSAGRTYSLV
jgi:hypothetical protein